MYSVVVLAWTWAWWAAAAALGGPWTSFPVVVLYVLGGVGPAVVAGALVASGRSAEGEDLRAFWVRALDPRKIPLPFALVIAAIAIAPALAGRVVADPIFEQDARFTSSLLAVSLIAGLAEEPGWRGYAQDGLQRRLPVGAVAAAIGVVWAVWHVPLFWIEGTYQAELGFGTTAFWVYLVEKIPASVVYAWVYVATGRSIAAVVLLHAGWNLSGELLSVDGGEGMELAVTALLAVVVAGFPRMLRPTEPIGVQ